MLTRAVWNMWDVGILLVGVAFLIARKLDASEIASQPAHESNRHHRTVQG